MIMTGMNVTEFKYILTRAVHEPSRSFTVHGELFETAFT